MADELIDIFNSSNEITGIKKMKSEAHRIGLWHRSSHVWIYNDKREVLLQLRAKEKALYPNTWDISVAGHIATGENPLNSAIREIKEEIGLSIGSKELKFKKIIKKDVVHKKIINREFNYIYFFEYNGDIASLALQKEEVEMIKFFPIRKLLKALKFNPNSFAPHGHYWNEIMDMIR